MINRGMSTSKGKGKGKYKSTFKGQYSFGKGKGKANSEIEFDLNLATLLKNNLIIIEDQDIYAMEEGELFKISATDAHKTKKRNIKKIKTIY